MMHRHAIPCRAVEHVNTGDGVLVLMHWHDGRSSRLLVEHPTPDTPAVEAQCLGAGGCMPLDVDDAT